MGIVADRVFVEVNGKLCEMTGYSSAELLGQSPRVLYPSEEEFQKVDTSGFHDRERRGVTTIETRWRTKDGAIIDMLISSSPISLGNAGGGVTFVAIDTTERTRAEPAPQSSEERYRLLFSSISIRDISERKNAEKAIREQEETLNALLNATTDMAFLVASDGALLACNDAFARAAGGLRAGDLKGRTVWEMEGLPLDGSVHQHTQRAIQTAAPVRIEVRHGASVHDVGIFPIVDSSGRVGRLAFFVRDITASRLTEEQLRQAQKMEAVGRLAGGIAHDFNNLITVIKGFSDLVLNGIPKGSRLADDIGQVTGAADRAAELTSQLLTFSRKQAMKVRVMDPVALIRGIEKMLKRVIGEDIEVSADLPLETGRIMADPGQIEQVLMNLAVNARDAMPRGGKLMISTSNEVVPGVPETEFPGLARGEYVRLCVSDTGSGMDKETLARIFEPFFTTKEPGRGTGMGLSTVYGIVTQSGGSIFCSSSPGQGTTFTIFFLRLAASAAAATAAGSAAPERGGDERVLLVEDEPAVRNYARRVLESHGYAVLEAGSGEKALELMEHDAGKIQLLLTDVVMTGMAGPELSARLLRVLPSVRTLFISGYTQQALESRGSLASGAQLLRKPFDEGSLLAAVRSVLDA